MKPNNAAAILIVLLALDFAAAAPAKAPGDRIRFKNLSEMDGLPRGAVHTILQDHSAKIWIATDSGIASYDGFRVKEFLNDDRIATDFRSFAVGLDGWFWIGTGGNGLLHYQPDTGSQIWYRRSSEARLRLTSNGVGVLHLDVNGVLWAGTDEGLNRLDRATMQFEQVRFPGVNDSPPISAIHAVLVPNLAAGPRPSATGRDAPLWVGTADGGVFRNTASGAWDLVANLGTGVSALAHRVVPRADGDIGSEIWVATLGGGIFVLDPEGRQLGRLDLGSGLPSADVRSLKIDREGIAWVGTAAGMSRFDPNGKTWTHHRHQPQIRSSLAAGPIDAIFEDRVSGVLWSGSGESGVSLHSLDRRWFPQFLRDPENPHSLGGNAVFGMAQTDDGFIWIATDAGLDRFDQRTGDFDHLAHDPTDPESLPPGGVHAILADRNDQLWLGMRAGGGLVKFDHRAETGRFKVFRHHPDEPASLPGDSITTLAEDRTGQIWVGVLGQGLARMDDEGGRFTRFPGAANQNLGAVNDLYQDQMGTYWIGTVGGGLWRFDPVTGEYHQFGRKAPENVVSLIGGSDGSIWVGSVGGGLTRIDPVSSKIKSYTKFNAALSHWTIFEILEDGAGNIWASTGAGLSRFDPASEQFHHYSEQDGLQAGAFNPKAALKTHDGQLLFGGMNGFNLIDPRKAPKETSVPLPILSGLDLMGEPVSVSAGGILTKPLNIAGSIRLPFEPNLRFGIRFGALDYGSDAGVQFRYRLEGAEDEWVQAGAGRSAGYFGLKPRRYVFRVEASPDGSTWRSLPSPLEVVIVPPWYRSDWAVAGFTLFGAVSIGLIGFQIVTRQEKRRREERQRLESERNRAEAALSRQIQQSMLVGSAASEFHRNLDANQVFNNTVVRLAEHFRVSRCLIAAYDPLDGWAFGPLAEYSEPGDRVPTDLSQQLLARVVASAQPIAVAVDGGPSGAESTVAARTSHGDQPNGMIFLQQVGGDRPRTWKEEEIAMLEAVATQLGLAIAQFVLSQKEARQRQELNEARQSAEAANVAKSKFLAEMTHEVRTPLNAIIGFSELIGREANLDPHVREHLEIISHSGEHLLGVVNDVLEIAKIEEGKAELVPETFDLAQTLRSVIGMLSIRASQKSIDLKFAETTALPSHVIGDKGKIRQILINIIGNAIKFTETGGVLLQAGVRPATTPPVVANPACRPLILDLDIIDTGTGIGPDEVDTLFDRFVQTQTGKASGQGSGLGLAIVKSFTELMGGRVGVESAIGAGTRFTLEIPLLESMNISAGQFREPRAGFSVEPARGEVIGLEPGHPEIRIMVVEDQPVNRILMRKILEPAGFTVFEAEDGKVAVDSWQEVRPDLIFMDEDMPVMRGTEATRNIIGVGNGSSPVIVSLSAFAMSDQKALALEAGCRDVLSKPFQRKDLIDMIAKHLPVRYQYKPATPAAAA